MNCQPIGGQRTGWRNRGQVDLRQLPRLSRCLVPALHRLRAGLVCCVSPGGLLPCRHVLLGSHLFPLPLRRLRS